MIELVETIRGGLVILHPPVVEVQPQTPSEIAMQTIVQMERQQIMPRATREFMIEATEREAAKAGISIEVLTAKNKAYRLLKAFDNQIAALRAQL